MTGRQLRTLRESLGLSQTDLAKELRDVSHATISRWEASEAEIPHLVAEKMLSDITITMPLPELNEALNLANRQDMNFLELLGDALREYISRHKASAKSALPIQGSFAKSTEIRKVAEDAADYAADQMGAKKKAAPAKTH